jgi:osmotically inducible lipoprotein OsmB
MDSSNQEFMMNTVTTSCSSFFKFSAVSTCLALLSACSTTSVTKQQIGTATGAVVGGVVGSYVTGGSTAGTVAGAAGGALVGNHVGKQLDKLK